MRFVSGLAVGVLCVSSGLSCEPASTSDGGGCPPCVFAIHPDLPLYSFTFEVEELASGDRVVTSVDVRRGPSPEVLQQLSVSEMLPLIRADSFPLDTTDLDLDGYQDISFITGRGVANTYADYWLFDSETGLFRPLGNRPWLTVDLTTGLLRSYERGGHGGMIYETNEYRTTDGGLTVVRSESQTWDADEERYLNVVRELVDGELTVVEQQWVEGPA